MPRTVHDGIRKRCDCARRQWPKCPHPWHFSFHHGGREHRYSLDTIARARNEKPFPLTSKADAVVWRDRLRNEIRAGARIVPEAPTPASASAGLTFGDVVTAYRDRYVHVPTRRPAAATMFDVHPTCCCGQGCRPRTGR
jgi:hypothetical protein